MASLNAWIKQLFEHPDLLTMGHAQRQADANIGLGWLYYGLARVLRPRNVVVIGSYRGFAPLVFARAVSDNAEAGQIHFIDPSLVDDFWTDPSQVTEYFAGFGINNVCHHRQTTQEFIESEAYDGLGPVGIVFIDGYHSAEQARFDFEAFSPKLAPQGMVLLHDSVWRLPSGMYGPGREYMHSVVDFVDELKRSADWQVFDVPFGDGVTLVRRAGVPLHPGRELDFACAAQGSSR